MSLRSINLNLVPVLRALLRERNLSRAAETLGLSQPAVSGALLKLRAVLDDPLLVRHGRGMALTLRARELIDPVEAICVSLEGLLGSEGFDPALSERRFVIASADYATVTIAPRLLRAMAQRAPRAMVHFVDLPHAELEPHAGEIDFFVVPEMLLADGRRPAMRHLRLIDDEFVTVVAADHPLADVAHPSEAELLAERYVIHYPALITAAYAEARNWPAIGAGDGRRIVAQVQQFSLLPMLASETGCAAYMPRRIAEEMRRFMPIRIIEHAASAVPIHLALAWHARDDTDPALRWFRKLLIEQCAHMRHETQEGSGQNLTEARTP